MRLHSRQPPVVGNLENFPETGFAEIGNANATPGTAFPPRALLARVVESLFWGITSGLPVRTKPLVRRIESSKPGPSHLFPESDETGAKARGCATESPPGRSAHPDPEKLIFVIQEGGPMESNPL